MNATMSGTLGKQVYELSLTRNYVSRWGMVQAVRELIQNSIDSDSPFVWEFIPEGTEFALSLRSEYSTLSPQTLLLGATSKADSKESIGSFGEGYKIALLVLTRLGHTVDILNGRVHWVPKFRHSPKFNEELLTIEETPLTENVHNGLTFLVHGLTAADVEEIRASCLHMQADVGGKIETPLGEILLERPAKLYVGGLFVCETTFSYGYNVKPQHLKLERDRQTVDGFDLKSVTRDMWFATNDWDRIALMIANDVPDVEYAEYSSPELVKEACFRLFMQRHPGAIVAKDQEELKKLVDQGMTKVVVVNSGFSANVRWSDAYKALPVVKVKTPHQRLEEWYADAKFHMHAKMKKPFLALLEESKAWKL